ncbi:NUDIX hydrolase [Halocalculus aciditolerans]|uniref:Coenzyme A pyrophosphatase n=1 Tax=Halocalculus aciditolerans TaxID=1383812 RepID=A0A830FN68_9EURY|nr:CoA pyrophosphatase [Halocalculus aciditolerans]GGL72485.1 coenzyme A pyrophosphatase [Halocalculus aciditolerans]
MNLAAVARHEPVRAADPERESAVLVPVVERDGDPHLLFTKRASHLSEHPGQMSFPGGGREPSDDSLEATALRECDEEIGLHSEEVEVVGRLDDIETTTGYAISPFVGRVPDRAYTPDEREVAEVAVLALDDLLDPANYEAERRDHPEYGPILVHFFHVDGYTVWGATGRILTDFLDLALDWQPPAGPEYVIDPDASPERG